MSEWQHTYPAYLENYVIYADESVEKAASKFFGNREMLVVLDEQERFLGTISLRRIKTIYGNPDFTIRDICNYSARYVLNCEDKEELYQKVFSVITRGDENFSLVPVIDEDRRLIDIVSQKFLLWKQYYSMNALPRIHYAKCIYDAAKEAKMLGYKSISVLEIGVAGGTGLAICEFHSRAVSRLLNIEIQVYGFDMGTGLNKGVDYRDIPSEWTENSFQMNVDLLKRRLRYAKLILGDIAETGKAFFDTYAPAPIGCMMIDVDQYTPTVHALQMLEQEHKWFLPRVHMYFDDILPDHSENTGEGLAVKEFNRSHETMDISPESYAPYIIGSSDIHLYHIKTCYRYDHPAFNQTWQRNPNKKFENRQFCYFDETELSGCQ